MKKMLGKVNNEVAVYQIQASIIQANSIVRANSYKKRN